jgi:hypothetical protein
MTQEQFTDAVMEILFVRGFTCPPWSALLICVQTDWARLGPLTDPVVFAESSVPPMEMAADPTMGTASPAAGARDEWLAVHEAGHAIVGLRAELVLRGVRFYSGGFPGLTLFEDSDWQTSMAEDLLRRQIRVDVAANIAEIMRGHEPNGGYPSRFFDDKNPADPGNYPTDIIGAWKRALRLATIRFERDGKPLDLVEFRAAKREIVERAEAEAEDVLRENMDELDRLAQELRRGPMTGTAVRAIVDR